MLRTELFLIILIFGIGPLMAQRQQNVQYPDFFQMEEPIKNPVRLPFVVLSRVYRDHIYKDQSVSQFAKTVAGTNIDLNSDGRVDFIVKGDDGANIAGFWLFRNVRGKQQLVFYTRALCLQLLRKTHKGMRDIEVAGATAVTLSSAIYRFDGRKYRPYRCWVEDMGEDPKNRSKKFYRCSQ